MREIELPPGTRELVAVYVNGVPRREGEDYDLLADRIRFRQPLQQRGRVTGIGKVLISIGIGVYPKGDVVDLEVRRGGETEIVRGRPPSADD